MDLTEGEINQERERQEIEEIVKPTEEVKESPRAMDEQQAQGAFNPDLTRWEDSGGGWGWGINL